MPSSSDSPSVLKAMTSDEINGVLDAAPFVSSLEVDAVVEVFASLFALSLPLLALFGGVIGGSSMA